MRYRERYYRWEWQLRSSPERLWPLVTDTNRFNRDTGLPSVRRLEALARPNARQRLGFSRFGVRFDWEEEPFEWVRPYRFGVVRTYRRGPVASMRVRAELVPSRGGTRLRYETWIRPRSLLGALIVPPGMILVNRRRFGAAFRRADAIASLPTASLFDPAGEVELAPGGRERLGEIKASLAGQLGDAELPARLADVVERGDSLALAKIRPYALADSWGTPRRGVLEACLYGTRDGLFDLQWDVLCPLCRGAKASSSSLGALPRQVHCDVCNIDFSASFDRSVELTFRPTATIRPVETGSYCVGGPQVTPHIMAQQLLAPGARRSLTLPLEAGRYRVRTLTLPGALHLTASETGAPEAAITADADGWDTGEQEIAVNPALQLKNATADEQLFILERMAWSDQAATAAEVTALQVFRDLFSSDLLRPGEQMEVGSLTILFTDLRDSTSFYRQIGDAPAFARVLDHFAVLREAIAEEDGAIVKNIGDAVMAVFRRPVEALRAVLAAQRALAATAPGVQPLYLKAGMHHGPCIAVTMNERLDYFGSTVNLAARLDRFSSGTDVIVSDVVRRDPEVVELLSNPQNQFAVEPFEAELKGFDAQSFQLWRVTAVPSEIPTPATN